MPQPHNTISYRPDIDGLRAVAVLPVILFHAGVGTVGGGYVGVDVFFVISGYLITALIAKEINEGGFSIVLFYERRARRIFPALFTVILASMIVGSIVFLPQDFAALGRSAIAATLFTSNILFWTESGYFAGAADLNPLLHTWSLAVEEQFYIFFPIFLLLVARFFDRRWIAVILPILAVSFVLSVWGVANKPIGAFYLAPSRAWELLLGSLLALGAVPPFKSKLACETATAVGFALILWGVFAFTSTTSFPGVNAVFPCLGTALIIHAGGVRMPLINRLLSLRPVVFVGLISYSLYLWHLPALAFARYHLLRDLTGIESAGIIGFSFVAAVFSWRFIERPFRNRGGPIGRPALFAGAAATMTVLVVFGSIDALTGGWPQRFPGYTEGRPAVTNFDKVGTCFLMPEQPIKDWKGDDCFLTTQGSSNLLLWGDSYAASYVPGLMSNREALPYRVLQYTMAGCHPVFGFVSSRDVPNCLDFNDAVFDVIRRFDIKTAVLIGNWFTALNYGLDLGDLRKTLMALKREGVRVLLVGPSPNFRQSVQNIAYISHQEDRARPRGEMDINEKFARSFAGDVALDPYAFLCDEESCRFRDATDFYFYDSGHLSEYGSHLLIKQFLPVLTGQQAPHN